MKSQLCIAQKMEEYEEAGAFIRYYSCPMTTHLEYLIECEKNESLKELELSFDDFDYHIQSLIDEKIDRDFENSEDDYICTTYDW